MKEFKKHKMIPANMKPEFEIRESDRFAYNFRVKIKRQIDPAQPFAIEEKIEIRPVRPCDYVQYFDSSKLGTQRVIDAMKAAGWTESELIHDPTRLERPVVDPEAMRDNEHKAREKKRSATVGDIVKLTGKE